MTNFITENVINRLVKCFNENGIYLDFDDSKKQVFLDNYIINYSNKLSAIQTLEEVFINMAYYFSSDKTDPFIVDAGCEVGVATIFFKIFYPNAKILCFEAHPYAFELLEKNLKINNLNNTIAINSALTNKEGTLDFFGEFNCDDPDTRGSSIISAWGLQRTTSSKIEVKSTVLSKYIDSPVDYLKLNVEGAEQQIIEELETQNKLDFINKILIKFHYSKNTQHINNLNSIYALLAKRDFIVKNKIQKKPEQIFPNVTNNWLTESEVCLYTLSIEKNHRQILQRLEKILINYKKVFFH